MPDSLETFLERRLPSALQQLRQWVDVNTYTRNADGVEQHADQLKAAFAPLEFAVERPEGGAEGCARHLLFHRRGSGDATVAMISHMDTVFPAEEEKLNNFHWHEHGERIYGPGTYDIKGGTLMILLQLEYLRETDPQLFDAVSWYVALNSSEEILNHRFGELCCERFPTDTLAALVFEGDSAADCCRESHLICQRKGRAIFRLVAEGRGAHAGATHEQGVNAIRQLAWAVEPLEALTDYAAGLTLNIGRVRGGEGFNRVPHRAEAELEMRAADEATLKSGIAAARKAVECVPVVKSGDGRAAATLKLDTLQLDPAWNANPGSERLLTCWQAAGKEQGVLVSGLARGGLSDGNFLWQRIPTIDGLGPAGGNAHSSEWSDARDSKRPEFVLPTSFLPKMRLNHSALLKLL